MCYHYDPAKLAQLQKRYPDKYADYEDPLLANGFTHPEMPVITALEATYMKWGLIPHWVKDDISSKKLAKMCLNAKLETITYKPSFRDAANKGQRCLIPANAFYEWRWEDEKGKIKTKYEIEIVGEDLFYFGGLYSHWVNQENDQRIDTYTILTCPANKIMEFIHNKKKRMPTLLTDETAKIWLDNKLNFDDLQAITQAQDLDGAALQ